MQVMSYLRLYVVLDMRKEARAVMLLRATSK